MEASSFDIYSICSPSALVGRRVFKTTKHIHDNDDDDDACNEWNEGYKYKS